MQSRQKIELKSVSRDFHAFYEQTDTMLWTHNQACHDPVQITTV